MEDKQQTTDGVKFIRGFPFPDTPFFKNEVIESILDYVPHDGDIVLSCYPKTGSTWLQYVVLQILSKGECFPSISDTINKECPIMELSGKEKLDAMKAPRIYKHHIAYNMIQKNDKAKFVYIYRNPEDTCVSFYHFMKGIPDMPGVGLEDFFESFLTGNVGYGNYFKNVLSYFEHKNDGNLLLVSYERLKLNTREEVLKIAKFLGEEYYSDISNSAEVMNNILEKISFDYMKKNLTFFHIGESEKENPTEIKNFFRKGTVGDGKQTLTVEQLNRLKQSAVEVLNGCEVLKEWYGKDFKETD